MKSSTLEMKKRALPFIILSIAMYTAGLVGLNIDATRALFTLLTPFHLLSSAAILIYFESPKSTHFWIYAAIAYFTGLFIEVAGVNTGKIFGVYSYGEALGYKIWNTPLMIGVNWFVLSFCVAKVIKMVAFKNNLNLFYFSTLGATAMTFFDFLAEPAAIHLGMWSWYEITPPLQNYVAWFITSWFLMFAFFKLKIGKQNEMALWILVLQVLFFGIQNLLIS